MTEYLTKNPGRKTWLSKISIVVTALILIGLIYFGYLNVITDYLSSERMSFNVGKTKLSAYILVKGIITLIILFWVTRILTDFGERRITRINTIKTGNKMILIKMFQILIYTLAFVTGLNIVGIDLTALAVFSGAIGIGVGFGLQKITSNFISGLILLFEQSVRIGDLIELKDGVFGYVRHMGARYTLVETFSAKETMIPNEQFITDQVTNWTFSNKKARLAINVGVAYDSDIEKARELMLEAAHENHACATDPEPKCFLREFGDNSVNFLLYFWVEDVTEGQYGPQSDVMRAIWRKFKENDISIPFPQRDIYIKNLRDLGKSKDQKNLK